jgi:hypothetical protein
MTESEINRYLGKPLLKLLDSYVLDALGVLDDKTASWLAQEAQRFAEIFGVTAADWQGVVEAAMDMPPDSQAALRELWEAVVREKLLRGSEPDVLKFAHAMVDQRFQSQ